MTTRHTPGPWQLQGLKVTTEGALGYIALVGESPTSYADAHLIAAAPAMLDALKAVIVANVHDSQIAYEEAIAVVEHAIAQAERRTEGKG